MYNKHNLSVQVRYVMISYPVMLLLLFLTTPITIGATRLLSDKVSYESIVFFMSVIWAVPIAILNHIGFNNYLLKNNIKIKYLVYPLFYLPINIVLLVLLKMLSEYGLESTDDGIALLLNFPYLLFRFSIYAIFAVVVINTILNLRNTTWFEDLWNNNRKKLIITTGIIIVIMILLIIANAFLAPVICYKMGLYYLDNNLLDKAYNSFYSSIDYKDSIDKIYTILEKDPLVSLNDLQIGDTVYFGNYEQDNNIDNGAEHVEWIVLEVEDGKALLVSKCLLDFKCYDPDGTDVYWETCSLRQWLNEDFFRSTFSKEMQEKVLEKCLENNDNPDIYNSTGKGGNDTKDKIFLLSIDELEKYWPNYLQKKCYPSEFAKRNNTELGYDDSGAWWLRTPGISQKSAVYVDEKGYVYDGGIVCDYEWFVRPCLWVQVGE